MKPKETFYKKLLHRALFVLAISGLLNVFFIAYLAFEFEEIGTFFHQQKSDDDSVEVLESVSYKLVDILHEYEQQSEKVLIQKLSDQSICIDGYKVCDIALCILCKQYHFDVHRALVNIGYTKRVVLLENDRYPFFVSLSTEARRRLESFVKKEYFPYTFEGLLLKRNDLQDDPYYKEALLQTEEYLKFKNKMIEHADLSEEVLFDLMMKVDPNTLFPIVFSSKKEAMLSFFQKMLEDDPKLSTMALVAMSVDFTAHKLTDSELESVLDVLPESNQHAVDLYMEIIKSIRSESIRKKAAYALCVAKNIEPTESHVRSFLDHYMLEAEVVEQKPVIALPKPEFKSEIKSEPKSEIKLEIKSEPKPEFKSEIKSEPKSEIKLEIKSEPKPQPKPVQPVKPPTAQKQYAVLMHTVSSGESLWSISKRYKVDVSVIRGYNQLQSDALHPGQELKIPITNVKK